MSESLTIPQGEYDGYIFDCDGTLVDSMPVHYLAWIKSLRQNGATFEFTEEQFYSYAGIKEQDIVKLLNRQHGTNIDPETVAEGKCQLLFDYVPSLKPVGAVVDVARQMLGKKPMSVASGSPHYIVEMFLKQIGILDWFPVIVTPEDVPRGKPAPDMFLLAAEKMGVLPSKCLVFEDGRSGIEAAEAAEMPWVFVPRRAADWPTSP
jgi:beta-phosphoglucomutase-like phosphatase (HAD superfamily)